MRFTQFGHQVPRRNSRISGPCARKPPRLNMPSRLAAKSEKSGAFDPISRVSVRSFIVEIAYSKSRLDSTLSEVKSRNNNGRGTGCTNEVTRETQQREFARKECSRQVGSSAYWWA